eukprot:CAMPEP_0115870272 /NCGR_PEP_ID=MMETSP0287-20121206/22238_1 /TAXON_ID=412157 /ORGANISM="Chrysochromulina rotalis, Strain UIO044" /LENGTH=68 /DNA_ID=CAMNT_0003324983 /DNA_START=22 /DNA_END=228 /DNA_ORIENTATION=+
MARSLARTRRDPSLRQGAIPRRSRMRNGADALLPAEALLQRGGSEQERCLNSHFALTCCSHPSLVRSE